MMNSRKRRAEGAWWRRGERAGIAAFGHRRDGHSGLPSRLALAAGRRCVFDRFPPPLGRCPRAIRRSCLLAAAVRAARGRCSCYSRPLFVLLAAEGSATRGRESMTLYEHRITFWLDAVIAFTELSIRFCKMSLKNCRFAFRTSLSGKSVCNEIPSREFCAIHPEFIIKPLFLILRNFAAEF